MLSWKRRSDSGGVGERLPRSTVRVLRDQVELASATERAADGERRLRARLDARAARDAWTAEQRQASSADAARFVQPFTEGRLPPPMALPLPAPPPARQLRPPGAGAAEPVRTASSPPPPAA